MEWSISYGQFSAVSHPQSNSRLRFQHSTQYSFTAIHQAVSQSDPAESSENSSNGNSDTLSSSNNFIYAVASGNFNVGCHRNLIQDILSQPLWQNGLGVLLDFRLADFGRNDLNAMMSLCDTYIDNNAKIGCSRIAILVSNDLAYGSVRQFLLLVADKVAALFKLTRELDDAVTWLRN
ncbi:MAG: hypothetical protein RKH07_15270 [Gammaproteobacteria bacterium]